MSSCATGEPAQDGTGASDDGLHEQDGHGGTPEHQEEQEEQPGVLGVKHVSVELVPGPQLAPGPELHRARTRKVREGRAAHATHGGMHGMRALLNPACGLHGNAPDERPALTFHTK